MQLSRLAWAVRRLALPAALALGLWLLVTGSLHSRDVHGQHGAGPSAPAAVQPGAGEVIVEISGFAFSPTVVSIEPGQTVTWVRRSGFHNVAADDGSYRSGPVSADWDTFSHTFTAAGESLYYCEQHGGPGGQGMAGKVIVQVSGQSERKLYLPLLRQ